MKNNTLKEAGDEISSLFGKIPFPIFGSNSNGDFLHRSFELILKRTAEIAVEHFFEVKSEYHTDKESHPSLERGTIGSCVSLDIGTVSYDLCLFTTSKKLYKLRPEGVEEVVLKRWESTTVFLYFKEDSSCIESFTATDNVGQEILAMLKRRIDNWYAENSY